MSENKKNAPKRRFKEFENDGFWKQRKLRDVLINRRILQRQSKNAPRLAFASGQGVIKLSERKTNNRDQLIADEFSKNYLLTEYNDIVYNPANLKYGAIDRNKLGRGVISPIYVTFITEEIPAFVERIVTTEKFKLKALQFEEGTVIKRQSVSPENLLSFDEMFAPTKEEQQKIGEFFDYLDNLITLHQRKLEKMKVLKKAYLTDMFPAEGERKPKLRFAGFTDDWEQRKLGELSALITKGTTPLDKSGVGNINFIKIENIDPIAGEIIPISKITIEEHEGYLKRSQLQENDILFSIAGTLGRVTVVHKGVLPANTNQALAIIRLNTGYLDYIITYLKGRAVSEYIKKNPTVGAQPNLSLEQVSNLIISLPKIEEQKAIGSFFQNLDSLITLHQHKLEKLQNIKKAYLNEMFI